MSTTSVMQWEKSSVATAALVCLIMDVSKLAHLSTKTSPSAAPTIKNPSKALKARDGRRCVIGDEVNEALPRPSRRLRPYRRASQACMNEGFNG